MRTISITDIYDYEAKEPVTQVIGKLIKLYQVHRGESEHGPWSIQKGIIKDHSGQVAVMFKDCGEVPQAWREKVVTLTAHKGDKGVSGLYAEDDTYKGQTNRILKVTKRAAIEVEGDPNKQPQHPPVSQAHKDAWPEAPESQQEPPDGHPGSQSHHDAQQQAPQAPQAPQKAPKPKQDIQREADRALLQIINFHAKCSAGVHKYESGLIKGATGHNMTESEVQTAIASIYIQGCRQGLHNAAPAKALTPEEL